MAVDSARVGQLTSEVQQLQGQISQLTNSGIDQYGNLKSPALLQQLQSQMDAKRSEIDKMYTASPASSNPISSGKNYAQQSPQTSTPPTVQNSQQSPTVQNSQQSPTVATVADITAPTIEAMAPMQETQVGDITEAQKVQLVEDPTIRNKQMEQLQRLEDRATGKTEMFSERQFKANLDKILKAQQAQAATTRGAQGSLLAQRESQIKGNEMMAEAADQAAMLRIKEQEEADAMFLTAQNNIRSLDMTKLIKQGELDTQTNLANLDMRTKKALTNAQLKHEAIMTTYTTEADRRKANANMEMQARVSNQQKDLQTAIANAQNKTSMINQEVSAAASRYSADRSAEATMSAANAAANASAAAAQIRAQADMYSTDAQITASNARSDMDRVAGIPKDAAKNVMEKAFRTKELQNDAARLGIEQSKLDSLRASQPTTFEKIFNGTLTLAQVAGEMGWL